MKQYFVIGLMSGTSLDGVDLVYAEFVNKENIWSFNIIHSKTYEYDEVWKSKLDNAMLLNGLEIHLLDIELGEYFSSIINSFIKKFNISRIDFISSHGHTIFHQPEKKLTLQIGAGQIIANLCKQNVICDFRKQDVSNGGQGAPLVPIGDLLLFSEYEFCLNIGGIANVSFQNGDKRIAYDICPANIVFNHYAELLNLSYDEDGKIAAKGITNSSLLEQLNNLSYYEKSFPKSLGKEWVYKEIIPLIESYSISIEDKLNTFCEHIAIQIAANCSSWGNLKSKLLITGGGVYHNYLIDRIKHYCNSEIIIPSKKIIEFKEALIFAFLGVLYIRGENNCLSSVTGAKNDHCSGILYKAV